MTVSIGDKFGRLTVLQKSDLKRNAVYWDCRCECGRTNHVDQWRLTAGWTTSCGCWRDEKNAIRHLKHGRSGNKGKRTRAYSCWSNMKTRCLSPASQDWDYYGGRGIAICARWVNSFEEFLSDMGEPGEGLTLDRIDVNGNYEPSNCRWATRKVQRQNQRKAA